MDTFLNTIGSYMFWALGILCLLNAAVLSIVVYRHNKRAILATAEVIALQEGRDSDDGLTYAPVFRIVEGPHKGKEWTSHSVSSPAMHEVGERVSASYDTKSGVIHSAESKSNYKFVAVAMLLFAPVCFWIATQIA